MTTIVLQTDVLRAVRVFNVLNAFHVKTICLAEHTSTDMLGVNMCWSLAFSTLGFSLTLTSISSVDLFETKLFI
jgi:hypothetical protein